MKTRKIIGGVSAAVAILSLSGAANSHDSAGCAEDLMNEALDYAHRLACDESYPAIGYEPRMGVTSWPSANPLWQKQAGKYKGDDYEAKRDELGCDVHESLVTKLYLPRDEYDEDNMPPYKGATNKKGNNYAQGAANALDPVNQKFETAVSLLESFKASVDSSKPNEDSKNFPALPNNTDPSQSDWETYLKSWADDMVYRVKICGHLDP